MGDFSMFLSIFIANVDKRKQNKNSNDIEYLKKTQEHKFNGHM